MFFNIQICINLRHIWRKKSSKLHQSIMALIKQFSNKFQMIRFSFLQNNDIESFLAVNFNEPDRQHSCLAEPSTKLREPQVPSQGDNLLASVMIFLCFWSKTMKIESWEYIQPSLGKFLWLNLSFTKLEKLWSCQLNKVVKSIYEIKFGEI